MKNLLGKIKLMVPAVTALIVPASAKAAVQIGGQTIPEFQVAPEGTLLSTVVQNGVNIFIAVVGILVVVYLIYGGVLYITSGGDAEKAATGKNAVIHAIIGIIIIVGAFIIYNFAASQAGVGNTQTL